MAQDGVCNNMAVPARTSWLESGVGRRVGQGYRVDNMIDAHYGDDKRPNRGADKASWSSGEEDTLIAVEIK